MNAPRLAAITEEADLDAIVAASPANTYYLSGYRCWLEPLMRDWMVRPGGSSRRAQESFAVSPRTSAPCLIVGAVFAPDALGSWVDDVRVWGSLEYGDALLTDELEPAVARVHNAQRDPVGGDAIEALVATLRDLGLADGRLGIEFEGVDADVAERLRSSLPRADLRDCTNLFRLVRMVKSEAELELLSRVAELNERVGFETALMARPGVAVSELLDRFRASVTARGADFDHFSPGIRGIGLSSNTDHVLSRHEVFNLDYGCLVEGYFSDAGLTVALGEIPPPLPALYDALREAIIEVGLGAMRPGVRASNVHHAMTDFLAARGITACFPHGHGLGLELRDYPILVPDTGLLIADDCVEATADVPLEPGMVVNLEVSIFLPGVAALEVEITGLVTRTGAGPFIPQDRAAPVRAT